MTVDPSDDDRLREALRRNAPPPEAAVVLRQLQPRMRRSRSHRRIAKGTATALLVVSGGAAVLAVNASIPGSERRALTTLPAVTGPERDESTSTSAVTTDRLVPAPTSRDSSDDPTSSIEPDTTTAAVGLPPETTAPLPSVPASGAVAQPVPTAEPPTTPAPVEEVTRCAVAGTARVVDPHGEQRVWRRRHRYRRSAHPRRLRRPISRVQPTDFHRRPRNGRARARVVSGEVRDPRRVHGRRAARRGTGRFLTVQDPRSSVHHRDDGRGEAGSTGGGNTTGGAAGRGSTSHEIGAGRSTDSTRDARAD